MAASETTICNIALGKLGARRIIALDEESVEARACLLHYAETRDEVLRHHRWNFAIKREALTQLVTPPAFEWRFAYELPVDCLRVLEVNNQGRGTRIRAWEVEGRTLLSDDETALVRYINRITDCNQFDSLFVEALATKLASKIARPLTGSGPLSGEMLTEYEKLTGGRARRTDAFEKSEPRTPAWVNSDLVTSRLTGGT